MHEAQQEDTRHELCARWSGVMSDSGKSTARGDTHQPMQIYQQFDGVAGTSLLPGAVNLGHRFAHHTNRVHKTIDSP